MTKQHMYTESETAESAVPAQTFANTSDCNLTQLITLTGACRTPLLSRVEVAKNGYVIIFLFPKLNQII